MNKVDHIVKQNILRYNSLFKARIDVLQHLFTAVGGGYGWSVDGELVYLFDPEDDLEKCIREERENPTLADRRRDHDLDFIDANIDEIATTKTFCETKGFVGDYCVEDPTEEFCLFFQAPDNITLEWKEALLEFGQSWLYYIFNRNMLAQKDYVQFNRTGDDKPVLFIDHTKEDVKPLNENLQRDFDLYNLLSSKMKEIKG